MIVYYHSPLPPVLSGIADYSFELIKYLKREFTLVLIDYNDGSDHSLLFGIKVIDVEEWQSLSYQRSEAVDLYQIGNNKFHQNVLLSALARPGIVVVHDGSISGLLENYDWQAFRRFTIYDLGIEGKKFCEYKFSWKIFDWQNFTVRNLKLLTHSAAAVIVHSHYLAKKLHSHTINAPVYQIDHHLSDFFREKNLGFLPHGVKTFIDAHQRAVKIGTFGFLTPPKRIDWLISAAKLAMDQGVDLILILAGKPHPDTRIEYLLKDFPSDKVFITDYITEEEMLSIMSTIDIQVTLRFPSVGESSGTLTRALGLGIPCIVQDTEAFTDFDDDYLHKIPISSDAPRLLSNLFVEYNTDNSEFLRKATAARNHIQTDASLEHSASGYSCAIRDFMSCHFEVSDRFTDIVENLANCFTGATKYENCDCANLTHVLQENFFDSQKFRQIATSVRSDIVSINNVFASQEFEIVAGELSETSRKIFLFSTSTDVQFNSIMNALLIFKPKRFDILCQIATPAWCQTANLEKQSSQTTSFVVNKSHIGGHLVTVREMISIDGTKRNMKIPVAVVVSEIL